MFISDYEVMKIHELRSKDLIREANQERLVRKVCSSMKNSRPWYLVFTVGLGSLLITWGEKLKNIS